MFPRRPPHFPSDPSPPPLAVAWRSSDVRRRYSVKTDQELGRGGFGVVRRCLDRETGRWRAVKSIRKSRIDRLDHLRREVQVLRRLDHPNIVKLLDVKEDSRCLHLILELCTGGELFDRVVAQARTPAGRFSEADAADMTRSILDAVAYCHDVAGVCHRDLKPENFLFESNAPGARLKVVDFGLSRLVPSDGMMRTRAGTAYYLAPEVLAGAYTKACDVWSIGVIAYILLCGYPPFYEDTDEKLFQKLQEGTFAFPSPDWDTVSAEAKDLIVRLLRKIPRERCTAAEALRHPWFRDVERRRRSFIRFNNSKFVSYRRVLDMNKLKKAALVYIAVNLTEDEVGELGRLLEQIDVRRTGKLTLEDLDGALADGNFGEDIRNELRSMREALRVEGRSHLDWKDFLAATVNRNVLLREDKIRAAFDFFDESNTDVLTYPDLLFLFGRDSHAREILANFGKGPDEVITYEEFSNMMQEFNSF